MVPVNLKILSKFDQDDTFNESLKTLSNDFDVETIKPHEINTIKQFVSDKKIFNDNSNMGIYDGFYVGFKVPHISKEFDLIKIFDDGRKVINIELKSELVEDIKIKKQLKQNKYYLSTTRMKIFSFCYIKDFDKIFQLIEEELLEVSKEELYNIINSKEFLTYKSNLDEYFEFSNFLVSPINNPSEFINDNYFLTNEQDTYKKKLLDYFSLNNNLPIIVIGKAGTGKTLLLFDIAKTICKDGFNVIYIFSGNLVFNEAINILRSINNFTLISIKDCEQLLNYNKNIDLIIIDESQYIIKYSLEIIKSIIDKFNCKTIFSGDCDQYLSYSEEKHHYFANIISYIKSKNEKNIYELHSKIRTNTHVLKFINKMLDYSKTISPTLFNDITILYADNSTFAIQMIEYYKTIGYQFINFTDSKFYDEYYDVYRNYQNNKAHMVKGQDIRNVLVILSNNFVYYKTNDGREVLTSKVSHPNPDYDYRKMLSQILGRVVNKLCIIIVNDIALYNKINRIKLQFGLSK